PDTAPRTPHSLQSNRCNPATAPPSATRSSTPVQALAPSPSARPRRFPSSQSAPAAPYFVCGLHRAPSLPPLPRRQQFRSHCPPSPCRFFQTPASTSPALPSWSADAGDHLPSATRPSALPSHSAAEPEPALPVRALLCMPYPPSAASAAQT